MLESTQALSRLLSEAIFGTNIERPASELVDVAEHELGCWGAAASSDLADRLESIYSSTRRPFDGPVGPDTWLDERNNALFRTRPDEEFETFAFPPPTSKPISREPPVRRRGRLARSARSASSSIPTNAPSLTSGPLQTRHAVSDADVALPPPSSHWSNKRSPTSDMDQDIEATRPHKRTRTDGGEVVVLQGDATEMETQEGEPEQLQTAEAYESTRTMVVVADHIGPVDVAISSSNPTSGQDSVGTEEAIEGAEADTEAAEEADDDQTSGGSVPVPAPPPVPAPAPVLAPAPRPKRARRTNAEIATTLVPGLTASTCGFPNCGFLHRPTSGDNNRNHIKAKHYAIALLSSANPLVCGWGNCGLPFAGTQMMAHVERDHIKYGYLCPIFGEDCPDHWRGSRAKDQTTHARRDH